MDRAELERLERQFCAAFPDAHHTVDDLIAEGDEFTGLVDYRIADGKIAESWGEIDFLRLIRELRREAVTDDCENH